MPVLSLLSHTTTASSTVGSSAGSRAEIGAQSRSTRSELKLHFRTLAQSANLLFGSSPAMLAHPSTRQGGARGTVQHFLRCGVRAVRRSPRSCDGRALDAFDFRGLADPGGDLPFRARRSAPSASRDLPAGARGPRRFGRSERRGRSRRADRGRRGGLLARGRRARDHVRRQSRSYRGTSSSWRSLSQHSASSFSGARRPVTSPMRRRVRGIHPRRKSWSASRACTRPGR